MAISKQNNGFSVTAYRGDAKTLLAFNLSKPQTRNLAGFTIGYSIDGKPPFYLQNNLRFKDPSKHVQDTAQSPNSCINAPIHKFRWVHVPGSLNLDNQPLDGTYTYVVTPRYFDDSGSLMAIDKSKTISLPVQVGHFAKGKIEIGNTRGFTQSQAFVHHFGPKVIIQPKGEDAKGKDWMFDTSQVAGKDKDGKPYTFAQEYNWLGFTARKKIFGILNEVLQNKNLKLDMFAYDLNEPDICRILLELAKQGRIRIILDNADLHHKKQTDKAPKPGDKKKTDKGPKREDDFEDRFNKAAKGEAEIMRGLFARYAHHKLLIVKNGETPVKVLGGSTNFSVTGLYVNSNHVLVFNDPDIAAAYSNVFNECWNAKMWGGKKSKKFNLFPDAGKPAQFPSSTAPKIEINFSPHTAAYAAKTLDAMAARITEEGTRPKGSVLFAVMGLDGASGSVLPALQDVHENENIFSYGISDSPGGICLYTPRKKTGVLVGGKLAKTFLPPPFDQVPGVGIGHQVHHKFIVCGFNGPSPVVYCGSSNLALGGEEENGDNLIAIHDEDIATVFAIEALTLVDHFDFLNRSVDEAKTSASKVVSASKQHQAAAAEWFLSTSDKWSAPYFDPDDLHCVDRELFGTEV